MRTFVFIPPVAKAVGGVRVLVQVAAHLAALGREARLAPREGSGWMPEDLAGAVEITPWDKLDLEPGDVWLVPEGWVNALAPGLEAKARCLVYCQNWAYLFSALPPGVTWSKLPVSFLAVSQPVAMFVEKATGQAPPILRPGIDPEIFHAPRTKPRGVVNVAYMPRKNKALVKQIQAIAAERQARGAFTARLNWVEVSGLDTWGVAEALRASHIFLASGFPEGCPLPPLEAMACGCVPVGFAGFGAWDYMRQLPGGLAAPWWEPPETPWGGNAFVCADNDVLDAALQLERCAAMWLENGPGLAQARDNGKMAAAAYHLDRQRENVDRIWRELAGDKGAD